MEKIGKDGPYFYKITTAGGKNNSKPTYYVVSNKRSHPDVLEMDLIGLENLFGKPELIVLEPNEFVQLLVNSVNGDVTKDIKKISNILSLRYNVVCVPGPLADS